MEVQIVKFYSNVFPNLTVIVGEFKIKFKDGVYETSDTKEEERLKEAGFGWEADTVEAIHDLITDTDEVREEFTVPKRWNMNKILEFAKENAIAIPSGSKKAEAINIVEKALSK